MRRFRFVAVLLSLALLTSLVLTISGAPPVEADGDIESEFDLGQGPRVPATGIPGFPELMPGDPVITPNIPAIEAPSGSGEFELDGDLDDLGFELEIEAEGLVPGAWYFLGVTLRKGHGGLQPFVENGVVDAGMARADAEGRLEFEGEGAFEADLFTGSTLWRFDQQIRRADGPGGGAEPTWCVNCILVCFPTTLVELVDGELVPFGDDD